MGVCIQYVILQLYWLILNTTSETIYAGELQGVSSCIRGYTQLRILSSSRVGLSLSKANFVHSFSEMPSKSNLVFLFLVSWQACNASVATTKLYIITFFKDLRLTESSIHTYTYRHSYSTFYFFSYVKQQWQQLAICMYSYTTSQHP